MNLYQPEQTHISFGDNTNEIVVTWSTFNETKDSIVEYGINGLILTATGKSTLFVDGGPENHSQWIHRVKLKDLSSNTKYVYHVGSDLGWSPLFNFKTPPSGEDWTVRLAIYGDMGNENAQSLARLQEESQQGLYDAILHVGDFAYDMDTDNARIGDEFMRQIEPLASYLPYMTCPGNHEEKYNFSNYKNRFSMPGPYENMMYSFNMGPIHFISINTEAYYFLNYGLKPLVNQYNWLENDLIEANKFENRAKRPWIILYGHRPMYCSNSDDDDCSKHESFTRVGLPFLHWFGLEKMLYDYGVDIVIWAHEHSYERTWPLYDFEVRNGSHTHPYTNPRAPIHIITGSAGCKEGRDHFVKNPEEWSAFHSQDYGYTRMNVYNSSHLYAEQVSVDKLGEVIDQFWIIKDQHLGYERL